MTWNRAFPVLAAALTLAACSESMSPLGGVDSPTLTADVARVAADGIGEDVELMRDPSFGQRFVLPLAPPATGPFTDQCDFDGEWHTCGPFEHNGLTFLRQVAFYGPTGPMENFDPIQTVSVRVITSVEGEVGRDGWSATIDRERDMTVSGLQGDEQTRTWNGSGSNLIGRSRHTDGGEARSYNMEESFQVVEVVVPHTNNTDTEHWPLSGTITRTVHISILDADGAVLREVERTVSVTFNGTQFVTMTVTGPDGSTSFEVDLAGRRVHRRLGR